VTVEDRIKWNVQLQTNRWYPTGRKNTQIYMKAKLLDLVSPLATFTALFCFH